MINKVTALLVEYTVKLQKGCQGYESERDRFYLLFGALVGVWVMFHYTTTSEVPLVFSVVFQVLLLVWVMYTYFHRRRTRLKKMEQLFCTLDRVIRRGSQLYEYSKVEKDTVMRLDLKLSEAEHTLSRAERFLSKPALERIKIHQRIVSTYSE